jgi:hypothetical protein
MPWQPHRLAVWNDATPAGVEAPETGSARQFKCAAEFVGGNAAVYFREARFGFGFVRGIILVHHVHIGVARQVLSDPLHDFAGVVEETRHDEMAYEDSAQCETVLIHS